MRRYRPRSATAAVVLLAWSPLVLWEIPGNAHNDIVMMFFAVAALYSVLRGSWQWAFPLLAVAIGVKFIMILLGPLLLIWLLTRRPKIKYQELLVSMAVAGALLALIYFPFVAASHSLANTDALRNRYISSPASLTIAFMIQYTSLTRAMDLTRVIALTAFALCYVAVLIRSRGEFSNLIHAAFWGTFLMLVLPTWWFWPWYVVWLVPIAAVTAGRKPATVALVFATSALMVYPIYYWREVILNGPNWYANQFVIVGAVFGPVALYLLGSSGLHLLTVDADEPNEVLPAA
jgi:alpha-1,6-mannosyltransferase